MNHTVRHPVPSHEEFALVDPRYIAVPGALWALAMVAVIVSTLAVRFSQPQPMALPAEPSGTFVVAA